MEKNTLRDANVDYAFLEAMGVTYKWYQPWQMGLFVPDVMGKFVWYPESGTLMYEKESMNNKKIGEFSNTEDVYNEMKKYVQ